MHRVYLLATPDGGYAVLEINPSWRWQKGRQADFDRPTGIHDHAFACKCAALLDDEQGIGGPGVRGGVAIRSLAEHGDIRIRFVRVVEPQGILMCRCGHAARSWPPGYFVNVRAVNAIGATQADPQVFIQIPNP